jgi:Flp pilus assembly protein TadD
MTGSSNLTAEQVVERARDLLLRRRDRENLAILTNAVERFPEDPEIRLLYATALLPFRPEDAAWEVATAIDLDPDDPGRLTRAASLMFHLDELDAARSYAARATQFAPPGFVFGPELANLDGKLAALDGDHQLAEDALRTAMDAEPEEESFARDLATFLADMGRQADALAVIDEALRVVRDRERLIRLRKEMATRS